MNRSELSIRRLPAEWEPQQAIMITWPNLHGDWTDSYDQVLQWYIDFTLLLSQETQVIVATPDPDQTRTNLARAFGATQQNLPELSLPQSITLFPCPTNDTWTRDHGPITILEHGMPVLLDYSFNAWGMKFPAHLDNKITKHLHDQGAFGTMERRRMVPVIEGGAIETNGLGELLVTTSSIIDENRNPLRSRTDWEYHWKEHWGIEKVHWLDHGAISGDDTDSHIDTLARFCDPTTILYQSCDDPSDEDFEELWQMKQELENLRNLDGNSYTLIPLPWPQVKYAPDGHRIPATYANFLITNTMVWLPTYDDPKDQEAINMLQQAFPTRKVLPIDCQALILQHGSLHCSTMNIPSPVPS
jgi:agmatine deiminase